MYPPTIKLERETEREKLISESQRNGDSIRGGGEGHDGAGGVQRRIGEHRRRRPPDSGEASVGGRFETMFLSGPIHIPHTQIGRPHFLVHGQ